MEKETGPDIDREAEETIAQIEKIVEHQLAEARIMEMQAQTLLTSESILAEERAVKTQTEAHSSAFSDAVTGATRGYAAYRAIAAMPPLNALPEEPDKKQCVRRA